jgi:hypothetical protein
MMFLKDVALMSKKAIWVIVIVAGLVLLVAYTKTDVGSTHAVTTTPSNSAFSAESDTPSAASSSSPTFAGSPCTSDCSGHEAGYNWAEEHGIDDESDCDEAGDTSNSPSFAEGCRAYVQENNPTDDTDDDSNN